MQFSRPVCKNPRTFQASNGNKGKRGGDEGTKWGGEGCPLVIGDSGSGNRGG